MSSYKGSISNFKVLQELRRENAKLRAEILRLQFEVANRNRRALDGDEAVKALDAVHAHYEKILKGD